MAGTVEGDTLFDAWITRIYATPFSDNNRNTIVDFGYAPFERLKQFLASKGAVGGRLFSKDPTDVILIWYLLAGYLLNVRERELVAALKEMGSEP